MVTPYKQKYAVVMETGEIILCTVMATSRSEGERMAKVEATEKAKQMVWDICVRPVTDNDQEPDNKKLTYYKVKARNNYYGIDEYESNEDGTNHKCLRHVESFGQKNLAESVCTELNNAIRIGGKQSGMTTRLFIGGLLIVSSLTWLTLAPLVAQIPR